jgi:hypothetical protein
VAQATGYRVYMFKGGKWTLMSTQKGVSYTAKSLSPNGNYGFYVQALREDNQGVAYSSQCTTKYINTAPDSTSNITVVSRNTNAINIKWNKVSGATGYQVFILQNGKWQLKSTQTGLTYLATGLGIGTNNSFMIKAYRTDSDGTAVASVYRLKNIYTGPGVTTSVSPSAIKTTSMKLSWYGVKNATGYRVYKKVGTKYVNVGTVSGTSHVVAGLKPTTTYQFAVKAFRKDSDGVVWAKSYKVLKYKTAPGVTARIATSTSRNAVKLAWNKVSGASGYKVYIKKGNKWVLQRTLRGRSCTIKGLRRRTNYQFAVRAYTKYGTKTIMSHSYRTVKARTR